MSVAYSPAGIATIPPRALYQRHESGDPVELIDVRTPAEYRSLHAAFARLAPLDEWNPRSLMESRAARRAPRCI